MYHKVLDLIAKTVSPERMFIYKDAVSILLQKDVAFMDVNLDNFYTTMFDNITTYNLTDWDNLLIQNLRASIEEFGVYIAVDMLDANAVEPMTYMLEALYTYDRYEDPELLISLLDSPMPSNELIAELVTTITCYDKVNPVMELIEEVSGSLIKRLHNVAAEAVEVSQASTHDYQDDDLSVIEHIARLCGEWALSHPLALIENGEPLGQELSTYGYKLLPDPSKANPNSIAKNFILAGIMAKIKPDNMLTYIGEYVASRMDDDPAKMLSVSRELAKIKWEL